MMRYTSAHECPIENDIGELVEVMIFCSDGCHMDWCSSNGVKYGGWNGCHEIEYEPEHPPRCDHCGDMLDV